MPAPKVRSDFDALQRISSQFKSQADTTRQMQKALKDKMQVLQGKDWVGKGADKFYGEMNGSVLPAVQRLATSLDSAARTTLKISQLMKQAEDDVAALFRGGDGHDHAHHKEGGDADKEFGFGVGAEVGALFGGLVEGTLEMLGLESNAAVEGRIIGKTVAAMLDSDPRVQAVLPYMNNDKQRAIQEVIQQYGIDMTGVKGAPIYDPNQHGEAVTFEDGSIVVGDAAFNSPGWLASTIGHEALHARQHQEGRWYGGDIGTPLNEVEAYDYEIAQAEQNGLSATELGAVKARQQAEFSKLPISIKELTLNKDYALPPDVEANDVEDI